MITDILLFYCIPMQYKCAMIKPLLKKSGLERTLKNYRPISNIYRTSLRKQRSSKLKSICKPEVCMKSSNPHTDMDTQ